MRRHRNVALEVLAEARAGANDVPLVEDIRVDVDARQRAGPLPHRRVHQAQEPHGRSADASDSITGSQRSSTPPGRCTRLVEMKTNVDSSKRLTKLLCPLPAKQIVAEPKHPEETQGPVCPEAYPT